MLLVEVEHNTLALYATYATPYYVHYRDGTPYVTLYHTISTSPHGCIHGISGCVVCRSTLPESSLEVYDPSPARI